MNYLAVLDNVRQRSFQKSILKIQKFSQTLLFTDKFRIYAKPGAKFKQRE